MYVRFLKVTPKIAIEALRDCIVDGSNLRRSLIDEYHSNGAKRNGEMLGDWRDRVDKWYEGSLNKLSKIYSSPVEPIMFQDHRAVYFHINMAQDFGNSIVKLEGKIQVLQELYRFILDNSNIRINAKGDVIFQIGDKNVANKNE